MASFDILLEDKGEEKAQQKLKKTGVKTSGVHSAEFQKFFGHITQSINRVSTGTKMALIGEEEIGKTYFLTTMPRPLAAAITDGRFMEIMFYKYRISTKMPKDTTMDRKLMTDFAEWLKEKEIYIYPALVLGKDKGPDYIASINKFQDALKVVTKHFDEGSFVVDNASDLKLWLNALVSKEAQFVNDITGMPYRFEWGTANEIVRGMTECVREKRIHFGITAHTKAEYTKKGKETNKMIPDWNRKTSGDLDFIMIGRKRRITQQAAVKGTARDVEGPYQRMWRVYKATKWPEYTQLCGKDGWMEDMTWHSLRNDVKAKIGFDIEVTNPMAETPTETPAEA